MVKTEISLFLKNAPGELAKLCTLMGEAGINIDAITIQDASEYVLELFRARGKSIKRIASAANYQAMRKDSAEFALVRLMVDRVDAATALLTAQDYQFDTLPVIALELDNRPGELAKFSAKLGNAGINIHYVYGSVSNTQGKCLFVFCPDNIEKAESYFVTAAGA
ncbi:MAG: cell division protein ZapD [Desulfobacterales bacterium]|jgi:hypothetical protein|nr:cell division protein ZapD [Desulfobacterales bacterium]